LTKIPIARRPIPAWLALFVEVASSPVLAALSSGLGCPFGAAIVRSSGRTECLHTKACVPDRETSSLPIEVNEW
jgi:hypothetical protein